MKKYIISVLMLILCVFGFAGCNCGDEETAEQRKLRLYDFNNNEVLDEWENPISFEEEYNGVTYTSRVMTDSRGEVLRPDNNWIYIDNPSDLDRIMLPLDADQEALDAVANKVVVFNNGTYFVRSDSHKMNIRGYRAYIVNISSAEELLKFGNSKEKAGVNMLALDSDKLILSLQENISFRQDNKLSEVNLINLNGAKFYGNGKTIEGFKLKANNMEFYYSDGSGENQNINLFDSEVSGGQGAYINLKYSLFSNVSAVYDTNVHLGYNNITIDPKDENYPTTHELVVDIAIFRNVGVIDNVLVRGKVDLNTNVHNNNDKKFLAKINSSLLVVGEDKLFDEKIGTDDTFVNPYATETNDTNDKYDYDRLIKTELEVVTEGTGEDVIQKGKYNYTYGDKIEITSISNAITEYWFDYKETEAEATASTVTYSDSANHLNIGGIVSNLQTAIELQNSISKLNTELKTGANIMMGGAVSGANAHTFIENVSSSLVAKINSVNESTSIIGSVVGLIDPLGEVKNCNGNIDVEFVGYAEQAIEGKNTTTTSSNLLIGGLAGYNEGLLIASKAVGKYSASGVGLVSSGAIAGAGEDGIFIKDIASIEANIKNAKNLYSASAVGSTIGGMIYTCIAEYTLSVDRTLSNKMEDNDVKQTLECVITNPYPINIGALYFQSKHAGELAHTMLNSIDRRYNLEDVDLGNFYEYDSFYSFGSENRLGLEYAPFIESCIIMDNTSLNLTLKEEKTEEDENKIESPIVYINDYLNLGGYLYYVLRDNDTTNANNSLTTKTLTHISSSLKINGKNEVYIEVAERDFDDLGDIVQNGEDQLITTMYSQDSETKHNMLNKPNTTTIQNVRKQGMFDGVDKFNNNEIEQEGSQVLNVKEVKINNVYPGRFLSPNGFTSVQMDTNLFGDLVIDNYDEFQYIINTFFSVANSSETISNLARKDLFNKVLLFESNMFEEMSVSSTVGTGYVSELGYKELVLEEETSTTGNRYKYDADGNPAINKVEVYDSSANSVGSAESKLLFAYLKSDEEKKSVFVFNKGNLTFAGGKYNIPNEYVVPETDAFNIRTLTAMEIMLLQHLTQIMDVEYVEVELEDRSDDHGLYQTAIFKIHKVGEEDKTTLDTYVLKTLATDEDLTHIPEDTNSDELTGIARDVENNNCLYMFYKI